MTNENVLRLIRLVTARPEGLTAAWEPETDRLVIEWADFPESPRTALLRASEAGDDDLNAAIRRFVFC
ncbi:hypothetical protein [Microbacterium caowuchunii]|uniref:Uncharacterized protein n=1 Tax=Microbacterium caowuchunii TaxID=2614638 RepID=A0A5N0TH42_9MICO|nr:hypothetical protein [Microbacterium caowuchunii]KAA9133778.1 hypothetical protein F6B40_08490 [Microbacterium caowuchunii]